MSGSNFIDWQVKDRPLTANQRYWKRRRKRDKALGLPPNPTLEPDVADIIDAEPLIAVFDKLRRDGGQAAGPDGISYRDWSRPEAAGILRTFSAALKAGSYLPKKGMTVKVPKASGGIRELTIRDLTYRVLAASLNKALSPFWERIFLPGSFGFRPGRSAWTLLASLDATMAAKNYHVLAVDDVRGAFDNVEIARLMDYHRVHIQNDAMIKLQELVIRGGGRS